MSTVRIENVLNVDRCSERLVYDLLSVDRNRYSDRYIGVCPCRGYRIRRSVNKNPLRYFESADVTLRAYPRKVYRRHRSRSTDSIDTRELEDHSNRVSVHEPPVDDRECCSADLTGTDIRHVHNSGIKR